MTKTAADWKAWRELACTQEMYDAIGAELEQVERDLHTQSNFLVMWLNAETTPAAAKQAVDTMVELRAREKALTQIRVAFDEANARAAAAGSAT